MPDSDAIVVLLTAADRAEASRLAELLIKTQLAACVQILPEIESIYRWQGKIERQSEVLLLAKTVRSRFAELEGAVRSIHSYETPEILALPVTACSAPYLAWLSETLLGDQNGSDLAI